MRNPFSTFPVLAVLGRFLGTIYDFIRPTEYEGLEYRRRNGLLRGAGLSVVRNHAFSYDVCDTHGRRLSRRYLFTAAQKRGLDLMPLR